MSDDLTLHTIRGFEARAAVQQKDNRGESPEPRQLAPFASPFRPFAWTLHLLEANAACTCE